ncbi:MAG: hypothetical protein ACYC8T_24215 [Myxococcaceae bacterium]
MNLARQQGLTFGRDFVFTYGPLGFLSTRMDFSGVRGWLLVSDAVMVGSFGFLLWQARRKLTTWAEVVIACLAFMAIPRTVYWTELTFGMLAFVIFYLLYYLETGRVWALVAAGALSIGAFYTKVNAGLVALALNGLVMAWLAWDRRAMRKRYLAGIAGLGAAVWLASFPLDTDLPGYLRTSVHFLSGYNDAMYMPTPYRSVLTMALITLAAAVVVALVNVRTLARSGKDVIAVVCVGMALAMLFKQGFVRGDGHVYAFLGFAGLLIGLWYLFVAPELKQAVGAVAALSVAFGITAIFPSIDYVLWENRLAGLGAYLRTSVDGRTPEERTPLRASPAPLPEELVQVLRQGTVDFVPWELSPAYYYGLAYNPRPVFQSYAAYDGYLDGLNATKFLSPSASTFVLFSYASIDYRYPLFDEAQTKLAMLGGYDLGGRYGDSLLLRRRDEPRKVRLTELSSGIGNLSEPLEVPLSEGLVYLEAEVRYSWRGQLVRLTYQPPGLTIRFTLGDGSTHEFRAVVPIISAGVPINRLVLSADDAQKFFSREFEALPAIRSITLEPHGWRGFDRQFRFRFKTVQID